MQHRAASLLSLALACAPALLARAGQGQALPAATGPGSYIAVGATGSIYYVPYGQEHRGALSFFADANLTRNLGVEAEFRFLPAHDDDRTSARTYLIGPRYSYIHGRLRPYGKVLFGSGHFTFPFDYAEGSYFVLAPGAGLDVSILHGRASIRAVEFEYQDWRDFTFGDFRPYSVSAGISIRIF